MVRWLVAVMVDGGVVAGGALVARDQRRRTSYTPDDIRARLHQRLTEAEAAEAAAQKRD